MTQFETQKSNENFTATDKCGSNIYTVAKATTLAEVTLSCNPFLALE